MTVRTAILMLSVLSACAGGQRHSEWDNLDYSRIAGARGEGNDSGYTAPVNGSSDSCLEDFCQ